MESNSVYLDHNHTNANLDCCLCCDSKYPLNELNEANILYKAIDCKICGFKVCLICYSPYFIGHTQFCSKPKQNNYYLSSYLFCHQTKQEFPSRLNFYEKNINFFETINQKELFNDASNRLLLFLTTLAKNILHNKQPKNLDILDILLPYSQELVDSYGNENWNNKEEKEFFSIQIKAVGFLLYYPVMACLNKEEFSTCVDFITKNSKKISESISRASEIILLTPYHKEKAFERMVKKTQDKIKSIQKHQSKMEIESIKILLDPSPETYMSKKLTLTNVKTILNYAWDYFLLDLKNNGLQYLANIFDKTHWGQINSINRRRTKNHTGDFFIEKLLNEMYPLKENIKN